MKLSKRCEYALKALTELAVNYIRGEETTLISHIAERENIPPRYLEQILLRLKNSGVLTSKRGVGGGYSLSRPPETISLGEIIGIVDGPVSLGDSKNKAKATHSGDEISITLNDVMKRLSSSIKDIIDGVSLKDVADKALALIEQSQNTPNYCI